MVQHNRFNRLSRSIGLPLSSSVAYFLDIIDASIVQVALLQSQREFIVSTRISNGVRSLRLDHSRLPYSHGKGWRRGGQKKIFMGGLIIFTIASFSVDCSFLLLYCFQGCPGIGAAMTTVTAFAILIGLYLF